MARAALAALDDARASSGEIRNARAVICLADGDPAAALRAVREVPDGTAPVIGYVTRLTCGSCRGGTPSSSPGELLTSRVRGHHRIPAIRGSGLAGNSRVPI